MTLILLGLIGCSSGKSIDTTQTPTNGSHENTAVTDNNKETDVPNGKDEVPGAELSTFISNYMDSKAKVWDAMTKKFEEDQNNAFVFGALPFAFADLAIVEVSFFDTLTVKDGDTFRGNLMFSGIEAWKKVKGNVIEFGYDFIYKEDSNQSQKGDRQVAMGKFDKDANSIMYEHYTERNGNKIDRFVVEITRNSTNSYSSQLYSINANESDDPQKMEGYLTWFEGTDIVSVIADQESNDFDFPISSIFGKKNVKPEEMAKDMNIRVKTSFIDGKSQFEELGSQ